MNRYISLLLTLILLTSMLSGCVFTEQQQLGSQSFSTQTPQPTTTVPAPTTTVNDAQLQLTQTMTITKWGDKSLRCSYSAGREIYHIGDTITVNVQVMNLDFGIEYVGALEDQFGVARLCASSGSYTIASKERPLADDATKREFSPGEVASLVFEFVIPQDAPEDTYFLEFSIFGVQVRFDPIASEEDKNIPVLADLPEDIQLSVTGGEMEYNSSIYQKYKFTMPVYGMFDGVYAYIYSIGYTSGFPKYETVNGLTFEYRNGIQMRVFSVEKGYYSLTDAFVSGILTAEQLQEVYDNYYYVKEQKQ